MTPTEPWQPMRYLAHWGSIEKLAGAAGVSRRTMATATVTKRINRHTLFYLNEQLNRNKKAPV